MKSQIGSRYNSDHYTAWPGHAYSLVLGTPEGGSCVCSWPQEACAQAASRQSLGIRVRALGYCSTRPKLTRGDRIFTTPWQKIIAATESIAESHQTFAANIEKDVEQPLRTFAAKNREMQAMSTIQGNLVAMQKELDEAQLKADKLGKKGGKANSLKVDNVTQKLETANSQWDSQAPFVFEKLQAVDESRLNHLRDVLTQYQTHEADQVERNRVTAETTLNALLEVDTSQEIQNFARNTTQGRPKLERNTRRTSSSAASNTMPPPPVAKAPVGDGGSEHSARNEGPSGLSSFIYVIRKLSIFENMWPFYRPY